MRELFETKKTKAKVTGFTSKAGNVFDACLKLEDDRISFDFDNPGVEEESKPWLTGDGEMEQFASDSNAPEMEQFAQDAAVSEMSQFASKMPQGEPGMADLAGSEDNQELPWSETDAGQSRENEVAQSGEQQSDEVSNVNVEGQGETQVDEMVPESFETEQKVSYEQPGQDSEAVELPWQ